MKVHISTWPFLIGMLFLGCKIADTFVLFITFGRCYTNFEIRAIFWATRRRWAKLSEDKPTTDPEDADDDDDDFAEAFCLPPDDARPIPQINDPDGFRWTAGMRGITPAGDAIRVLIVDDAGPHIIVVDEPNLEERSIGSSQGPHFMTYGTRPDWDDPATAVFLPEDI